jgi:hypothetical protein
MGIMLAILLAFLFLLKMRNIPDLPLCHSRFIQLNTSLNALLIKFLSSNKILYRPQMKVFQKIFLLI